MAKERKEWISNITWDNIDRRRLLKAQICGGRDLSEQQKRLLLKEYRSLAKEVNRNARKDHRGYIDGMAEYAHNAAEKGNMKELYDTMRKMVNAPECTGKR
jgi:hypothetical protein